MAAVCMHNFSCCGKLSGVEKTREKLPCFLAPYLCSSAGMHRSKEHPGTLVLGSLRVPCSSLSSGGVPIYPARFREVSSVILARQIKFHDCGANTYQGNADAHKGTYYNENRDIKAWRNTLFDAFHCSFHVVAPGETSCSC